MSSVGFIDNAIIRDSTLYQTLVRVADKQAQERELGIRKPSKQNLNKYKQKRRPGRPKKASLTIGATAAGEDNHGRQNNIEGVRNDVVSRERRISKETRKRKYKNWSKENVSHVLCKYDEFLRVHELGKNGSTLAMRETLKYFKDKFGFEGLRRQHIQHWKKTKRDGGKRGRRCILSDGTMQAIHRGIIDTVKAKVHKVTSDSLYPIVRTIIENNGEDSRIGEEPGKLKLTKWWINKECRRLGLVLNS